jgi:tRNA threonylcarbamoyladenosine biosynthesis protein TsaE
MAEYRTNSPEETITLGRKLAAELVPPKLVLLRGELGAGKTTLVKGIAEGFAAAKQEDVTSPTFTLIHEYRGPKATVFHIDLYRVDTPRQLETLGIDDLFGPDAVILVEWGEKFSRFVRERDVEIAITSDGDTERTIEVVGRRNIAEGPPATSRAPLT